MITIPQLTAQALGSFLARETEGRFRSAHSDLTKLLPFAAKLALECIGNSDALYHDIEHTMLVTLVGHDILAGRALQRTTTATDCNCWVERFKCPECGRSSTANLTRSDGHAVAFRHGEYLIAVDSPAEGFKVVGDPQDIDVLCVKCNVSAWP
jgi:hypothetical protein